ncbi:hypothetical protein OGAPHI_004560 [Ogataea philodendri]|uniref:Uncharacterized protein n=1 Tax=Ogataea philodendri TaxID=1378263 RepID=A0A9P8P370_9ASCO|nr:uncharacterized protein OGAPHI_004560 [Ogataea philodendri]KAH3664209.1 hypothetical protein OGAPHI_004560 [Ogataea philodendri]
MEPPRALLCGQDILPEKSSFVGVSVSETFDDSDGEDSWNGSSFGDGMTSLMVSKSASWGSTAVGGPWAVGVTSSARENGSGAGVGSILGKSSGFFAGGGLLRNDKSNGGRCNGLGDVKLIGVLSSTAACGG